MEIGTEVAVFCSAELAAKNFVGLGEYVADATVYFIVTPNNEYFTCPNREKRPSDETVKALGGKIEIWEKQPKLFLRNGAILYGYEVYHVEYTEVRGLVDPILRSRKMVLNN